MNPKFEQRMTEPKVRHDVAVVGDFTRIYCEGTHGNVRREPVQTAAAQMGVYGKKRPVVCAECEQHLAYAEKRRALCPKDPKPFCAHCDTHCYKSDERAWQGEMMRYSGPRSWRKGHLIDDIRHLLEGYRLRRETTRR